MSIVQQFVIVLLTTSFSLFVLAIFVYLKNTKRVVNKTHAFSSLSAAIWSFGQALHNSASTRVEAIFWARFSHIGTIFISTAFVHFTLSLLELDKSKRRLIKIIYFTSFIFLFFDFTPLFIPDALPKFSLNYYWTIGPIYPFFLIFWIGSVIYGLQLLYRAHNSSIGQKRSQLKLLFWSLLFGYIGGSSNYLPAFNINLYPFNPWGTFAVPIYASVVAYAIVRHRLMDIQVVFSKSLVAVLLGAGVIGFDVLFVKLLNPIIGYYFSGAIAMLIIGGVLFATPLSRKLQLGMDQLVCSNRALRLT